MISFNNLKRCSKLIEIILLVSEVAAESKERKAVEAGAWGGKFNDGSVQDQVLFVIATETENCVKSTGSS